MKSGPVALAFHGIAIRSRNPKALARRLRAVLGWPVLRKNAREVVLGAGPELFISIQPARRGDPCEGVSELHLAVEQIRRARRRTEPDLLGGDSWTIDVVPGLAWTVREFRRAPRGRWRTNRAKV